MILTDAPATITHRCNLLCFSMRRKMLEQLLWIQEVVLTELLSNRDGPLGLIVVPTAIRPNASAINVSAAPSIFLFGLPNVRQLTLLFEWLVLFFSSLASCYFNSSSVFSVLFRTIRRLVLYTCSWSLDLSRHCELHFKNYWILMQKVNSILKFKF